MYTKPVFLKLFFSLACTVSSDLQGYPPASNPGYPPASNPGYPPASNPGYPPSTHPAFPPPISYPLQPSIVPMSHPNQPAEGDPCIHGHGCTCF